MDTHEHGLHERPVAGCSWCRGYFDGFMTGPDGVDPQGNRHNVDPGEPDDSEYVEGAEAGLSARMNLIEHPTTWATT